jgi:hypothetical protein
VPRSGSEHSELTIIIDGLVICKSYKMLKIGSKYHKKRIEGKIHIMSSMYGWLQNKRELSEKVLSDFIKFL